MRINRGQKIAAINIFVESIQFYIARNFKRFLGLKLFKRSSTEREDLHNHRESSTVKI